MLIIKVGGGTAINQTGIVRDIKSLKQQIIFVHGARKQADQIAQKLGIPTKRITSPSGLDSIFTDRPALEVMLMSYAGLVNKQWVELFHYHGLNAIGLSGADGKIWQGQRKTHLISQQGSKQKLISNTFTGKVDQVNTVLIKLLLKHNYLPVITQPAISYQGELINTDNDLNIAVMTKALKVKQLVVLFEAPGLLQHHQDESTLIKQVASKDLFQMLQFAQGTMKKKILGAQQAFQAGIKTIYWGDSRLPHPVKSALAGKGTVIS